MRGPHKARTRKSKGEYPCMEQLIEVIFSPSVDQNTLHVAQEQLRDAQKSSSGWALAQSLLSSPNPNAQFLGAQTFLVQLNNAQSLPPTEEIKKDLISAVVNSVEAHHQVFVTRKLLGAVTKMFLDSDWPECPLLILQILQPVNPQLCFEFVNFLIEDAELSASNLREKLIPNVSSLVLDLIGGAGINYIPSLKTIELWASTFFEVFYDVVPHLVQALGGVIGMDEELAVQLLGCISNLYTGHWHSWKPSAIHELVASLSSTIQQFNGNFDLDSEIFVSFTRLVVAVCEEDFAEHHQLYPFLASVAGVQVPVVDDPLSSEVLEFWNQYIEEVISYGLSVEDASQFIVPVISGYWPRIKLYPQLRQSDWDEMASFRKDFTDFLELAYPLLGLQLFDHLTSVVLSSLETNDWMTIESALYSLNGLSDIIGTDYNGDTPEFKSVLRIFQSVLWERLPQCDHLRVKQTAVNTIGCFVDFFLSPEGQPYLAVTLNYLFSTLYTPFLQNTASRSVQKLCDICRSKLVTEIPAFLTIYGQIRAQLVGVPHIRTVSGIACVIQAISDTAYKLECINQLFMLVESMPSSEEEPEDERKYTRLKCLAAMGKNFQSPEARPTDKEALAILQSSIRPKLESLISAESNFNESTVTEGLCEIIKVSLADDVFSLSEDFILMFIVSKIQTVPESMVSTILDLSRVFVATRLANLKQRIEPQLSEQTLQQLLALTQTYGVIAASSSIDLLTQIIITIYTAGKNTTGLQHFFNLPLKGMEAADRFVLRSSVNFWKEYLSGDEADPQLLSSLVQILLIQASGGASRSELSPISEVFKSLMVCKPLIASQMLRKYTVEEPVGRTIAKQEEKTRRDFVAQLILVKGGRKTTDIVQQFWQTCRGIPSSYNPIT